MMKKLLSLITCVFVVLFFNQLKAQNVTIDSLVITSDIDCYGDFADIEVYVDNDTILVVFSKLGPVRHSFSN